MNDKNLISNFLFLVSQNFDKYLDLKNVIKIRKERKKIHLKNYFLANNNDKHEAANPVGAQLNMKVCELEK